MPAVSEEKAKTLGEVDEENAGKKAKVPKPAKAPKKKKEKKEKKEKAAPKGSGNSKGKDEDSGESEPKKHTSRNVFILTNVFWVLLALAFVAMFRLGRHDADGYYHYLIDPEGVIRGPVMLFLNPEELTREEYYAAEFDMLRTWEQDLTDQEAELETKIGELDQRESDLDDRDSDLSEKEAEVEDILEQLKENLPQGSENSYDITVVANMVRNMSASKAAVMLSEINDDSIIISILKAVSAKVSGAILDAMDPELSAPLIEEMGTPPDLPSQDELEALLDE